MPGDLVTAPEGGFKTPEEALASLGPLRERLAQVTDRTPSTVLKAMEPVAPELGGLTLPPITLRTWRRLERIESPFLNPKAEELSFEDMLRTFYVIAMPADEVGRALQSPEAMDAAVEEFAALVPLSALPLLAQTIAEHIAQSFEPRAAMAFNQEGNGGGPKVPANPSSATEPAVG